MKRKLLHRGLVALVLSGLFVLAGCERVPVTDDPDRVTQGPVDVSLIVSFSGYGDPENLTKADFAYVAQDIHYDHEKQITDVGLFLFDAKAAVASGTFKPEDATWVHTVAPSPEHIDSLGAGRYRLEFVLPSAEYEALAVLMLANYKATLGVDYASLAVAGDNMQSLVTRLADDSKAAGYNADQSLYIKNGVPMHGWQVFGSKDHPLKFYTGMSTPLTQQGFATAAGLGTYVGTGTVKDTDHLPLQYALARLHLSYQPESGQPAKTQVELKSVSLRGYKKKVRLLPPGFLKPESDPTKEVTPFDAVTGVGDFDTLTVNAVRFHHLSKTGQDGSMVAYVPEAGAAEMEAIKKIDGITPDKPALKVEVSWKKDAATQFTYTYWRDWIEIKKTVTEGGVPTDTNYPRYYGLNSVWRDWTGFRTVSIGKKKKDGSDVPLGTAYNVVRHYSYEWIATGFEGLPMD